MKTFFTAMLTMMLIGCAANKIKQTDLQVETKKHVMPEPVKPTPVATSKQYIVKKNDCLWKIAGKAQVFGDSFLWPILYQDNRLIIKNADVIKPNQILEVRTDVSTKDKKDATDIASNTPPYKRR